MAVNGHVHSVKLENGNYYHLFALQYMNVDEISVLQSLLNGQAVEQNKLPSLNSLKKSVEEIINMAIVRDTQPEAERIDFDEEAKNEEIKDVKNESEDNGESEAPKA